MKFLSFVLAVAAGCVHMATAMSSTDGYAYNVTALTISDPGQDCGTQMGTCAQLCSPFATSQNMCLSTTLFWVCTCRGAPTPNITQYLQTMPYFECNQYVQNCKIAAGTDAAALAKCDNTPCPTKQPAKYAASRSAALASSLATPSSTMSSSMSASPTSTKKASSGGGGSGGSGGAGTVGVAQSYGVGAFAAGLLALIGFAI